MNFYIELFEYLINTEKLNNTFIQDIMNKLCEKFKINSIGILNVLNKNEECYLCNNNAFYNDITKELNTDETKISLKLDTEFKKIFNEIPEGNTIKNMLHEKYENTDDFKIIYDIVDTKNDHKIIFIYKNDTIDVVDEITIFSEVFMIIKNILSYKNKISNLDERKMHFITNMNHEVRTPLNSIISISELLLKKYKNDDNRLLQIIRISSLELLDILNNILDYSKVVTNKMKIKYAPISLHESTKTIISILEISAKDKNLEMIVEIGDNVPDIVISDGIRLKQVLINILSNSIKFTKKGSVKLIVTCENKTEENCNILFKVIDTGVGVPHDLAEKIFDYFSNSENDYFSENDGIGIGLSISRHIVNLLKGKIWIENNDDAESGTIMNIKIKFDIFNTNIDEDIIKDYFFDNKMLILNNDMKSRVNIIKIFSEFKINIIQTLSIEETNEYLKNEDMIDVLFIDSNSLSPIDIEEINTMNNIIKILIIDETNNKNDINILYDYKISKPIEYNNILKILNTIYIINKFKTRGIENEVIFKDKKEKLSLIGNHDIMNINDIKILLVEDNKQNQKSMTEILKFKKYENIDFAEDGEDAINKMTINDYNLVFMDIKIPIYDGITVTKKYREIKPDSKTFITAVTAGISEEIKEKCFEAKMDAFLAKPFDIDNFDKVIKLMIKKYNLK